MTPERLHELLASALLVGIVPSALLAWRYLQVLERFFQELRDKEPALARQIGSPRLWHMLLLPFFRFRKYTAFLPHLKQRAEDPQYGYRHARPAYRLLRAGLAAMAVMFGLVAVIVGWVLYHDL